MESVSAQVTEARRVAAGGEVEGGKRASHRRLRAFLPPSLDSHPVAMLESELQEYTKGAHAEGSYQRSRTDYAGRVEIEIAHYGNSKLTPASMQFNEFVSELGEFEGFESAFSKGEDPLASESELWLKVTPMTYVGIEAVLSKSELEEIARTIDLDGLVESVESGEIFEPNEKDLLASRILSREGIAELLPTSIGPLERKHGSTRSQLDRHPMFSSATGSFGQGSLTVFDYGSAEIAAALEVPDGLLSGLDAMLSRGDMEREDGEAPFEGGEARWILAKHPQSNAPMLGVRVLAGRYVAEYSDSFHPMPEGFERFPNAEEMVAEWKAMGAGAFETVEAQRDAVLEALAGLGSGRLE